MSLLERLLGIGKRPNTLYCYEQDGTMTPCTMVQEWSNGTVVVARPDGTMYLLKSSDITERNNVESFFYRAARIF